ncbi:unnamed protein product [Allacma fusca]|uniref:Uncharacterized protein n=1 Tax=Allacma fusca TaxID=39272 RepID=A0A8J2JFG5_9HEXA|nr:unnamed protein product [Allacma fusca]
MHLRTAIILFVLSNYCCNNIVSAQEPGNYCDNDFDCTNGDKRLVCNLDLRICLCQPGAEYDWLSKNEKTCQLLVGQSCRESNLDHPRTTNSWCDAATNLHVECLPNYFETKKRCARPYNADCGLGRRDCNEYAYEQCISIGGRVLCRCDENSIYVNGRCVLKADEPCTSPPAETWSLVPQECSPLSKCTRAGPLETCKCNGDLHPNKNGLCKVMHNGNCDLTGNLPCDDGRFLNCINSKCSCESGALYEEAEDSCVLEANRQCDPLGTQKCTKYSGCYLVREGNDAGYYFCMCRAGLIENTKKQCVIPYGDDCGGNGDAPCNEEGHQACSGTTNKKCTCQVPTNSVYDPQTKSCYLLATAPCQLSGMPCIDNAECSRDVCVCKDGLRQNSERKCVLDHGMQCNVTNSLCDPVTYLSCNGTTSTCQCASKDAIFDGTTCRLKANSQCDPLPGKQRCIDLAQCDQFSETCQCTSSIPGDNDLISNPVGECVRRYNARCNIGGETEGDCDRDYGFQTCNQENTCVCLEPENMTYNPTDGRCSELKNKTCTKVVINLELSLHFNFKMEVRE